MLYPPPVLYPPNLSYPPPVSYQARVQLMGNGIDMAHGVDITQEVDNAALIRTKQFPTNQIVSTKHPPSATVFITRKVNVGEVLSA